MCVCVRVYVFVCVCVRVRVFVCILAFACVQLCVYACVWKCYSCACTSKSNQPNKQPINQATKQPINQATKSKLITYKAIAMQSQAHSQPSEPTSQPASQPMLTTTNRSHIQPKPATYTANEPHIKHVLKHALRCVLRFYQSCTGFKALSCSKKTLVT